jgi:hypothetical protein
MKRGIQSGLLGAGIGAAVWMLSATWQVADLRSIAWSSALLTFAALVLVPLVLDLAGETDEVGNPRRLLDWARLLHMPAAVLLTVGCRLEPGAVAAGLALPWVALTGLLALAGVARIARRGLAPLWKFCRDAGLAMIAVGGAWTLADRLALHPLGFGPEIVQLTAVHFHYAGLVLPVITACVLREFPRSRVASFAGWGVLAGVPLVALGITSAQLGGGTVGEMVAAMVLAPSAMIVAVLQLRLALTGGWPRQAQALWVVAGMSLLFGMTLALLYAARDLALPLPWLNIPWMRALHGTANALGFALCGTLGWWLARRRSD